MIRKKRSTVKRNWLLAGKLSKPTQAQNELVHSGFLAGFVSTLNENLLIQPCSTPALSEQRPLDFFTEKQRLVSSCILSAFNNMMGFHALNVKMMREQVSLMRNKWSDDEGLGNKWVKLYSYFVLINNHRMIILQINFIRSGNWYFNVLQHLVQWRVQIELWRVKVSTREFNKEMIEFCKWNSIIMLMTYPIGNSHAIAVRDKYVIDSLHPSERLHVQNFNFSSLDRNQI